MLGEELYLLHMCYTICDILNECRTLTLVKLGVRSLAYARIELYTVLNAVNSNELEPNWRLYRLSGILPGCRNSYFPT